MMQGGRERCSTTNAPKPPTLKSCCSLRQQRGKWYGIVQPAVQVTTNRLWDSVWVGEGEGGCGNVSGCCG